MKKILIVVDVQVDFRNGVKKTFGSAELAQEAMQWSDCEEDVEIKFVGFCTDICVITNVLLVRTLHRKQESL